jgi:transposase
MTKRKGEDAKRQALRDSGTLNPHAETVSDELFAEHEFFDPDDLLQLKYEMLRRVRVDKVSVSSAAGSFGLSRPTFYKAQADYERGGLCGLLPAMRGPRRAHKLSEPVMEFVASELVADSSLRAPELARRIKERFGLEVHPRSVERALQRGQKKTR